MVRPTEPPDGNAARSLPSLLIPLTGSLLLTYGAVWAFCGTPYRGSLSWVGWFGTGSAFLLAAALAHVAAVRVNRRLFQEQVEASARKLLLAIWPTVVWLPLEILLTREQSPWSVAVPGLVAVSGVSAVHRWMGRLPPAVAESRTICTLLLGQRPQPFPRALAPALVGSAALHGAAAELLRSEFAWAGWLLAVCVGVCRWRAVADTTPPEPTKGALGLRSVVPRTLLVLMLLLVALLPYVGSGRFAMTLNGAFGRRPAPAMVGTKKPLDERVRDSAYSGVILLFSAKPHREVVIPPPPAPPRAGLRVRRPVLIPFDGAYWYFRQPDERPRPDAPVVRGDPRKKTIRSTDFRALSMEAHQRLGEPVPIRCCRAIRLTVENGEPAAGAIVLEVLLRNHGRAVSLGSEVVPSSVRAGAAIGGLTAGEVLSFPFPARAAHRPMGSFDEIAVVIRPRSDRARAGAHLAIQSFELLP